MPKKTERTKIKNVPIGRDNIRLSEKEISESITAAKDLGTGPNWSPRMRAAADRIIGWLDNPRITVGMMVSWTGTTREFVEEVAESVGKPLPAEPTTAADPQKRQSPYIREPRNVDQGRSVRRDSWRFMGK